MSFHATGSCSAKHIYSRSLIHPCAFSTTSTGDTFFFCCAAFHLRSQWAPWFLQTLVLSAGWRAQCWPPQPGTCWERQEVVLGDPGESQVLPKVFSPPAPPGCCYLWSVCRLAHRLTRLGTAPSSGDRRETTLELDLWLQQQLVADLMWNWQMSWKVCVNSIKS